MPTEPLYEIHWAWIGDQETPYITGKQGDAPMSAGAARARVAELNQAYPQFRHWPEIAKPSAGQRK